MKFIFKYAFIVFGFGLLLSGCGKTSCDDKGIADQALDILLQEYNQTAKDLGFYTSNVVLLDAEQNICQAKVGIKVLDEFTQMIQNKEVQKKMADDMGLSLFVGMVASNFMLYRLMGYDVSIDYDKQDIVNAPDVGKMSGEERNKYISYGEILGSFINSTINYKVTSNNKGDEYIIAELNK
ncbi:hypothetical protein [Helicobacter rodentium]|uniref:hypothetical protein n=1 Tax=Helicobacter rodentium TaxID=59617 RepID=UPI00047D6C06|nr:hypothetical protein [Helicobacter rodentium]